MNILIFYGSYRADRAGIRLARFLTERFAGEGHDAQLVDAQEVGLPMLDRMYEEYPKGEAPPAMEAPRPWDIPCTSGRGAEASTRRDRPAAPCGRGLRVAR